MRCRLLLVLIVASCGRAHFAESADASVCIGGDGVCLVACASSDPDCTTTCGDGRCVGNAGELCSACASDCAMPGVCGNGACEPGEAASGCYADCGPAPWPWSADEAQLVALINQTRAAGYACTGSAVTAPELAVDPTLAASGREWSWEIAHQGYLDPTGGACDGRTIADREAASGFTGFVAAAGYTNVQDVVTAWLADPVQCGVVMSPVPTQVFAAVAADADHGYVVLLR